MRLFLFLYVLIAYTFVFADSTFISKPAVQVITKSPYKEREFEVFSPKQNTRIIDFFEAQYKKKIFSGTYLFHKNDSMIRGHLGYANFSKKDPFIDDDLFQLASVSKTFTGTAAMILVQEGKLALEDSVHWYIPELKRENLTIKDLLSHTSGLPDYFYFKQKYWPYAFRRMHNTDVISQLNKQPYKSFNKPGKYYHYSNTNYSLLAHIISRITGMDFRQFVKKRIMEPAGMVYSHICDFDSVPLKRYSVQGYERWRIYEDLPLNGTTGDKGIYSNTYEMYLYDQALRSSDIVHGSSKNQMWSPIALASLKRGMYYGLGWRVIWHNGHKWVYHNGWWKGFRTYFWRCVDENMCFVVLTNNVQGPFLKTAEMLNLIDPVYFDTK